MRLTRRHTARLVAASALGVWPAAAQQGRPVTLVVAYPAGGDTDALARLSAERLAPRLGRPVVVENRSGASGAVGSIYVARAAPDGDTLLFAPNTFPIVPHVLKRGANYDPVQDFTPIALIGTTPLLLVASRQSNLHSLADLRAQAAAGKVTGYGTPGSGSPMHILGEMFNRAAGLNLTEVAYRGVAAVINDLLAGVIAVGYVTPGAVMQHVRAGTLVPIAVSERDRSPVLPDVPSFAEAGFGDVVVGSWWGVLGPKGMPPALAATLSQHFDAIVAMPDMQERMAALGVVPGGGGAERLTAFVTEDYTRFGKLVKELNIQAE